MRTSIVFIAVVSVIALLGLAPASRAALAAEPRASLPDIEDEVMCPICGTTLELSASPQAERQRALIRRLIGRGLTKKQIKDELVEQYGPEVLAEPEDEGFDLAAWIVPIAGLLLAGGAIVVFLLSRRRQTASEKAPADLGAAEAQRLSDDMSRYEL